jgi:aminoglycoside phosphotransferase
VPAERLAVESAVSTLEGQAVLVTEHVEGLGARHETSGPTILALGATLGRLHALPVEQCPVTRRARRAAGAASWRCV